MPESIVLQMPTNLGKPAAALDVATPAYKQRKGITRLTVDIPSSRTEQPHSTTSQAPSRWITLEFLFYGVVFALVVPVMVWIPMRLSDRTFQTNYC